MTMKTLDQLRSRRWFAAEGMRAFSHRQRIQQMGLRREDVTDRPIIAIVNTWSDLSPCHAHLRERAEDVKRGILLAGGMPFELPAMSLGEVMVKPTTMLYRNFLAMEVEARNRLDGLVFQIEKTYNENKEKLDGAVQSQVETAIADSKKALEEGGLDRLNNAFSNLQTASHKLAESLYQGPSGAGAGGEQANAAGASTGGASGGQTSAGDDNVIDAEYVDVDENK